MQGKKGIEGVINAGGHVSVATVADLVIVVVVVVVVVVGVGMVIVVVVVVVVVLSFVRSVGTYPDPRYTWADVKGLEMYSCCAIVPPRRKTAFPAEFWPDCCRENTGSRPATIQPGRSISDPEALWHNLEYLFP